MPTEMTPDAPSDDAAPAFSDFPLDPRILEAVTALGFDTPTPIQAEGMIPLLEGRDVIGRARTGSGKTAAYGLPLLERVKDGGRTVRALVLAPTRELALQITEALRSYATKLDVAMLTVYGGTSYTPQLRALSRGVTVVVGTPGRVLDHMDRGTLDLSSVEVFILDEADEMLRMGFIDDVEKVIAATPEGRQVALFSASMPDSIRRVSRKHLNDPIEVQVERRALTVEHIEQRWIGVPTHFKLDALVRVLKSEGQGASLVFARTRRQCAEVADELARRGIAADALHGDLSQDARERVIARLRAQRLDVVIATDVAARGIDVQHLTHVINFDLPDNAESYTHRIGRTGRAGRAGRATSFVTYQEHRRLIWMERTLRTRIERVEVPSDAVIIRRQRESLQGEISAVLSEGALDDARAWLAETMEAQGWSAEDVATAALLRLARQAGVTFGPLPADEPPQWARPRERRPRDERPRRGEQRGDAAGGSNRERGPQRSKEDFDRSNEIEIFLPIGRRDGVRAGDLVGSLANEKNIPGREIGRITIMERKSFVGLPKEVVERITALRTETLRVRGHDVPLRRSHGKAQAPGGLSEQQRPAKRWQAKDPRKGAGGARSGSPAKRPGVGAKPARSSRAGSGAPRKWKPRSS